MHTGLTRTCGDCSYSLNSRCSDCTAVWKLQKETTKSVLALCSVTRFCPVPR